MFIIAVCTATLVSFVILLELAKTAVFNRLPSDVKDNYREMNNER